jgi:hypothetical protein
VRVFFTLAQIGLGFAGFSSLVITLRPRTDEAWSAKQGIGMRFILEHSFAMVLFALMPPLLYYWLGNEQNVWRISDGVLALFLAIQFINHLSKLVRSIPSHPHLLLFCYLAPTAILFAVEVSRVWSGSMLWFGTGLLYLLAQAATQFWIFLDSFYEAAKQWFSSVEGENRGFFFTVPL